MKALLETLNRGTEYLTKKQVDDARLNMEHLLAHVLGCRRLDLYLRFDQMLDESHLQPLRTLLKRRGEGEPLQHLLGTVPFFGNDLVCDTRALIPRPETEHLVYLLVKKYAQKNAPQKVLDVGTGSGCIGLSLAKTWAASQVTLVDVSEDALELARLNAQRLELADRHVRFVRSDLFEELPIGQRFDLIVANLPYIPTSEMTELSREVLRDPRLALDGGDTGLVIIERLLQELKIRLTAGGLVALELHHDQATSVQDRMATLGLVEIQREADLSGIERFVFARGPEVMEEQADFNPLENEISAVERRDDVPFNIESKTRD